MYFEQTNFGDFENCWVGEQPHAGMVVSVR